MVDMKSPDSLSPSMMSPCESLSIFSLLFTKSRLSHTLFLFRNLSLILKLIFIIMFIKKKEPEALDLLKKQKRLTY